MGSFHFLSLTGPSLQFETILCYLFPSKQTQAFSFGYVRIWAIKVCFVVNVIENIYKYMYVTLTLKLIHVQCTVLQSMNLQTCTLRQLVHSPCIEYSIMQTDKPVQNIRQNNCLDTRSIQMPINIPMYNPSNLNSVRITSSSSVVITNSYLRIFRTLREDSWILRALSNRVVGFRK